jgi:enediyne biosynthesis protein E4
MGLDFADTNGDGLMDIYVSNIADDFALHEGHFVFVSTGQTELFQQGIAPYHQRSSALGLVRGGWGWDCRFADFSNDGVLEAIQATGFVKGSINRWPELHALGTTNDRLISNPGFWPKFQPPSADLSGHNPNPFYVRRESGCYADVSADLGMDIPWNTRGLAIADVDGDGWLDFLAANQWEPSVFFRNQSFQAPQSTSNSFIGLHLILPPESSPLRELRSRQGHPGKDTPGRPAIGAIVTVQLATGELRVSHVDGGSGHSGKRAPTVHFGLGSQPPAVVGVTLNWRDRFGFLQEETIHLASGRWHTVELGKRAER